MKNQTILIKNATLLVTMDGHRREIRDGGLFARNGFIEQIGILQDLPETADQVLDLSGHIVLPGLVNTHHHFYQTLTRAVPAAQDAKSVSLVKNTLSNLGENDTGGYTDLHANRVGGIGTLRMYYSFGSFVSLSKWLKIGR